MFNHDITNGNEREWNMNDLPVITTESVTPQQPFSTTGYFVRTTFWVTLLPGIIVSTPALFLACFSPLFFVAIPFFAFCIYL
ncbi:MAG: hypothetical protein LBQ50_07145 [Planctomycetaceae bacterium]|jgi:hypothetical protein|nr:hypothetical protein [Planctomycetaceae bacterium]